MSAILRPTSCAMAAASSVRPASACAACSWCAVFTCTAQHQGFVSGFAPHDTRVAQCTTGTQERQAAMPPKVSRLRKEMRALCRQSGDRSTASTAVQEGRLEPVSASAACCQSCTIQIYVTSISRHAWMLAPAAGAGSGSDSSSLLASKASMPCHQEGVQSVTHGDLLACLQGVADACWEVATCIGGVCKSM
jgi:hypothetical protein